MSSSRTFELSKKISQHIDHLAQRLAKLPTAAEVESLRGQVATLKQQVAKIRDYRKDAQAARTELEELQPKLKVFRELEEPLAKLFGGIKVDMLRKMVKDEIAKSGIGNANVTEEYVTRLVKDTVAAVGHRIVKEELSKVPASGAAISPASLDKLKEEILNEVHESIKSSTNVVMAPPKEFLLKTVLRKEVDEVRAAVEGLKPQTRLMLGYLAASGKSASFKDLMARFVGGDSGGARQEYLYPLRNLPAVVEYDSDHGNMKYVWQDRMKAAYPDVTDSELDAAMSQVHAILVEKLPA